MPTISLPLPLEDAWNDVLGKAIRGTKMDEKNLAPSANIIPSQLKTILSGERPSEDTLRRLAIALGLRSKAFLDLAFQRYKPKAFDAAAWKGVAQVPTAYMDMVVNSYLLWDTSTKDAVLFDTGTELAPIQKLVDENQLKLKAVFITHTHGDHIAILEEIVSKYQPQVYSPKGEPVAKTQLIEEGFETRVGGLSLKTYLVDGHSVGHLAYVVTGPSGWPAPVAVVGDAIFAGSMGGGAISYDRLRNNVQTKLLTLPPKTLLCPGHGPTTTVEEEENNNPFA